MDHCHHCMPYYCPSVQYLLLKQYMLKAVSLYASDKVNTCSGSAQARQAGLPADASCEDLQIDASLPFLNAFVQQALEGGAAPYISQQQRDSMGVMPTSRYHEAAEQPHALRFAAYETAKAPGTAHSHNLLDGASQGQRSRSNSPVKGVNCIPCHRTHVCCDRCCEACLQYVSLLFLTAV